MLKAALYSTGCYAVSASVFVIFTFAFVRQFGVAPYADFSIFLNTLSGLLLLGNYHGYLVSYSVASERVAFHRYFVHAALPYVAIVTPPAAVAFASVTGLRWSLVPVMGALLALLFTAGMPISVLMASRNNWHVNACRAVYQMSLLASFWAAFAVSHDTERSFVGSGLVAATTFLSVLLYRAMKELQPSADLPTATRMTLFVSAVANVSLMLTLLADKFALNHLSVGVDRHLTGLYMLYYDILSRASTIYVILVCPLTYHLLDRIRHSEPVGPILLRLAVGAFALGALCLIMGYVLIPRVYGTSIAAAPRLPLFMALLVAGQGLGSILGAYCNAAGRAHVLMWQNAAVLAVVTCGIVVLGCRQAGFTVTQLALVLAVGNGLNGVTLAFVALPNGRVQSVFRRAIGISR